MVGKNIQETYGVRVFKDGVPILEYPFHSLMDIYKESTKYKNEIELSKKMASSIYENHLELYDKDSTYTAEIVYYPNKEDTKRIINMNSDMVMTNGVTSEYMPILYSMDKDIFDEVKTKKRYIELIANERFKEKISSLFKDAEGLSKDAEGYKSSVSQANSEYHGMRLYDKVSSGQKWYTAIYVIMSKEFKKKTSVKDEEIDMSKPEISFKSYIMSPKEVTDVTRAPKPTKEDLKWYSDFIFSGEYEQLKKLQGEENNKTKTR